MNDEIVFLNLLTVGCITSSMVCSTTRSRQLWTTECVAWQPLA